MPFSAASFKETPRIETRKALLLLDLQNDFVEAGGRLYIPNTADFLHKIPNLASKFRESGEVVWVQSQFLEPRASISAEFGTLAIILKESSDQDGGSKVQDKEGPQSHADQDKPTQEPDLGCEDAEAFLAPRPSNSRLLRCCVPGTQGSEVPTLLLSSINHLQDAVTLKSHYSALKDPSFLLSLRMKFVTELYLCGSLSNISVYATALDAVGHGMAVTVIEDCVGYRSEECHVEAMRQMADSMGVNGVDYQELLDDLNGELGEVINEDTFKSRFEITFSHPRRLPETPPLGPRVQEWVSGTHNAAADRQKSGGVIKQPTTNPSSSTTQAARAHSPESLSPPRKRSPGEVEDDGRQPKMMYSAGQRRLSTTPLTGSLSTARINKTRVRRRPIKDAQSAGGPDPPMPVDIPETKSMPNLGEPVDDQVEPQPSDQTSDAGSVKAHGHVGRGKRSFSHGDTFGEGDTRILHNFISKQDALNAFENLKSQVKWQKMYHRSGEVPRLVAVQGEVDSTGAIPIYRHPADESPQLLPFSSEVQSLRQSAEQVLQHPLNHVLIQLYRGGEDNISEHSDKTLDITQGSSIVNVSFGAQRTMTLRMKRPLTPLTGGSKVSSEPAVTRARDSSSNTLAASTPQEAPSVLEPRLSQRIPMPHNSAFILGQKTNQFWLHGIRADKRRVPEKSAEELDFDSVRISLTFRHIGTFIDPSRNVIWGQGATSKDKAHAKSILTGEEAQEAGGRMLLAFGRENHQSHDFSWEKQYGDGFDVINFVSKEVKEMS